MTTLTQAKQKDGYSQVMKDLPQLKDDGESFRMLWHSGYWDGPMSGVALVGGAPHHFACIEDDAQIGDKMLARVFAVLPLTEAEHAELRADHELFESLLGKRGYTYVNGKRQRAETHIPYTMESLKAGYYDQPHPKYDFGSREISGWWAITYPAYDGDEDE